MSQAATRRFWLIPWFLTLGPGSRDWFNCGGTVGRVALSAVTLMTAGVDHAAGRSRGAEGDPGIRPRVPSPVNDSLGAGD